MGNGFFNETGPFVALLSQSNPQAFIQVSLASKPGSGTPTSHPARNPFSSTQFPISRPLACPPSQSSRKLTNNKGVWAIKGPPFSASVTSFLSQSPSFPELPTLPTRLYRGVTSRVANAQGLPPNFSHRHSFATLPKTCVDLIFLFNTVFVYNGFYSDSDCKGLKWSQADKPGLWFLILVLLPFLLL